MPHIGYASRHEHEIQFSDIFDQFVAYAAGSPINAVNPEVLRTHTCMGTRRREPLPIRRI